SRLAGADAHAGAGILSEGEACRRRLRRLDEVDRVDVEVVGAAVLEDHERRRVGALRDPAQVERVGRADRLAGAAGRLRLAAAGGDLEPAGDASPATGTRTAPRAGSLERTTSVAS